MGWRRAFLGTTLGVLLLQPGRAAAAEPSASRGSQPEAVSLESLVREAMERNPEIEAARRTVEAKRTRIPQARAWPDPRLSVSYAGNLLPPFTVMRGDPSSARQVMAEQEIPYPGKTRLRAAIASKQADAESAIYEAVWRRVTADVKQAYFNLYFTDRSLSTLEKDRELLEKFEKIAEIRYSVGKAAQQDVLKAQVELTRLLERQAMLEQARHTLEAQLNSLRNLPVDTPLGPTARVEPSALDYSLDQLEESAQQNFPVLKRARTEIEADRLAVDLARKDVRPDFSLGYVYMQRPGMPDMYGLTFSTSLPIFRRHKQDMAIAEAAANLESSKHAETNERAMLRYRVKQEYLDAQTADQLMKLYSRGIVPQSSLALESSLASYETGGTDFLTVISNFTAILDAELAYDQQVANHQKALTRLEELTALPLIP